MAGLSTDPLRFAASSNTIFALHAGNDLLGGLNKKNNMAWLQSIGAFFGAIGAYFGWAGKRSDLNNTEAMKKADEAQKAQDLRDSITSEIKNGNIESLRKRGSH